MAAAQPFIPRNEGLTCCVRQLHSSCVRALSCPVVTSWLTPQHVQGSLLSLAKSRRIDDHANDKLTRTANYILRYVLSKLHSRCRICFLTSTSASQEVWNGSTVLDAPVQGTTHMTAGR